MTGSPLMLTASTQPLDVLTKAASNVCQAPSIEPVLFKVWPPFWLQYTSPDDPASHPWDASLKHTDCGSRGLFRFVHERPPSFETTTVPPLMGIRTPCMINGALPPAIPHPCVALTK